MLSAAIDAVQFSTLTMLSAAIDAVQFSTLTMLSAAIDAVQFSTLLRHSLPVSDEICGRAMNFVFFCPHKTN